MILASTPPRRGTLKALQVPNAVRFEVPPVGPSKYCRSLPTVAERSAKLKSHWPVTRLAGAATGMAFPSGAPNAAIWASLILPTLTWMLFR